MVPGKAGWITAAALQSCVHVTPVRASRALALRYLGHRFGVPLDRFVVLVPAPTAKETDGEKLQVRIGWSTVDAATALVTQKAQCAPCERQNTTVKLKSACIHKFSDGAATHFGFLQQPYDAHLLQCNVQLGSHCSDLQELTAKQLHILFSCLGTLLPQHFPVGSLLFAVASFRWAATAATCTS